MSTGVGKSLTSSFGYSLNFPGINDFGEDARGQKIVRFHGLSSREKLLKNVLLMPAKRIKKIGAFSEGDCVLKKDSEGVSKSVKIKKIYAPGFIVTNEFMATEGYQDHTKFTLDPEKRRCLTISDVIYEKGSELIESFVDD